MNRIIDRGMELAGLKVGAKILDIGCGEGDVLAHLVRDLGFTGEGIDINLAKVSAAKEKHPDLDIKFGDGEFLEDYMSYTFDGVLMEGCLSRINLPDEALHEAYCVLKKGGRLIVIDRYHKDPDPKQVEAVRMEAERLAVKPRKEMQCEEEGLGMKFVDFRFEGAFYREALIRQVEKIGYKLTAFEDITDMCPDDQDEKATAGSGKRNVGRFILVATKPVI